MHGTLALFVYMVMQASHKDMKIGTQGGIVEIKRGQFISGRHKLSAAVGLSEQSTRTCLERLHALDIITSESTNHFSIYTIVNYGQYQDIADQDNQHINQQVTSNQPAGNQQVTTKQELLNTISIIDKPLCASSDDECADNEKPNRLYTKQFISFWDLYPCKKSKGGAAKVFSKIKPAEYQAIRAGLTAAIASSEWKKNGGQFIPHPATWLNNRGWEDEQIPTATNKPFNMDEFLRNA